MSSHSCSSITSEAEFLSESIPTKSFSKCPWVFWPEHEEPWPVCYSSQLSSSYTWINTQSKKCWKIMILPVSYCLLLLILRIRSLSSKYQCNAKLFFVQRVCWSENSDGWNALKWNKNTVTDGMTMAFCRWLIDWLIDAHQYILPSLTNFISNFFPSYWWTKAEEMLWLQVGSYRTPHVPEC